MLEFFDNFRVLRMNFYQFLRYWQHVASPAAGLILDDNTDITGRKYRYKTVSRHQLLFHQLRIFEKVRFPTG
ncbi:MAG: hypothetical protein EAZ23_01255 [Oscillatoriales cyanobacterium]|nr:MAG: hypothetical protein EAZ23_01255 [Oscillatoriales cyanobacterium]